MTNFKIIEECGDTIVARSRWLYDNEPLYRSAADVWVSTAVSDGIKLYPRIERFQEEKKKLLDLWEQWNDEADYNKNSDLYGLQETIAREVFLTGECFVRLHYINFYERSRIPLQLQIYPSEMLDLTYNRPATPEGNAIRMGIEFNAKGKRVAYHFWKCHPYNDHSATQAFTDQERVRVPAELIIHIKDRRTAGQLRGCPKVTHCMTKIFELNSYDEAELDRKRTTTLSAAFITESKAGKTKTPYNCDENKSKPPSQKLPDLPITPGSINIVDGNRQIKFSNPVDVRDSYEAFQYRHTLKIASALGVPYSILTGDVTRGSFSNVRTSIMQFRRRVKQWREHIIAFQFNRIVWERFVQLAVLVGCVELPEWEEDPSVWTQCESLAPPLEMIDPNKDISAEKEEIRAGLKTRRMALAERGFDIDTIHAEFEEEQKDAKARRLSFDTDSENSSAGLSDIDKPDESGLNNKAHEDEE
ncbi:phage portal protein [Bartonella schoenbuchensis]|uniref:phage portal protein n=1 Tax=Bartonella schoenbuchensis TaxID=165694 RepID=UPI003D80EE8F